MTDPSVGSRSGGYLLLGLGSLAYGGFLFVWFLVPAFLSPIISSLGISSTAAGLLTGAIPLIYIPLSLTSGVVIDRIGSRRAIGWGILLLGLAGALRGIAPGFPTILALTFVLGVGGTGITFGLPKLVSDLFPPTRAGTMSSIYLIGSYLGTAAAFAIGRPVLGPALGGWRPVLLWSGVAVVGIGGVWMAVTWHSTARPAMAGRGGDEAFSVTSMVAEATTVLGHNGLRRLVVVGTMYLFVMHGLQAWLVTILEGRGFASATAASLTGVLILGRVAGTISIPPLSDLVGRRRGALVFCGSLVFLGTIGLVGVETTLLATVGIVVAGIGLGGVSPLVRAIPIELDGIGPERTAAATGLIFTVGEIGGFSGPFLVGALYDLTGTHGSGVLLLAAAAASLTVAGATVTGIRERA